MGLGKTVAAWQTLRWCPHQLKILCARTVVCAVQAVSEAARMGIDAVDLTHAVEGAGGAEDEGASGEQGEDDSNGEEASEADGEERVSKAQCCLLYTSPSPRDAHES
eukprot:2140568-Prymnesium_polylepis.2